MVIPVNAGEIEVASARALSAAIARADPGDTILLLPGVYRLGTTEIRRGGRSDAPITITADAPGQTRIETSVVELFKIRAPHWRFIGLDIRGNDRTHHAFHLVENAHGTLLRGNRMVNFHATLKSNPENGVAPSDVVLESNLFFNETPRPTSQPVTLIDVVGGARWIVRGNFISDFAKAGGDRISYAAFLKGGSRDGLFEGNLVICEWRHAGGRRVGLSLGGGGTFRCTGRACEPEHDRGTMLNNVILNCPEAPGIYLNQARSTRIYNNTIYRAFGVVLRFPLSTAMIRNNIISGAIAARSGAVVTASTNLETGLSFGEYIPGAKLKAVRRISDGHVKHPNWLDESDISWLQGTIAETADWLSGSFLGRGDSAFDDWFVAPGIGDFRLEAGAEILGRGEALSEVQRDFCGQLRSERSVDLGAVEYGTEECLLNEWLANLGRAFE